MRSGWMILLVAVAYAMAPNAASADDAQVQEQLKQMQERLMLLEDKLTNTTDQLESAQQQVNEQKQVMSNAGLQVDDAGASGVDSFLQSLEIGGWVNISYWHNFNDPTNGDGCGFRGASLDANTGNLATGGAGAPVGAGGAGVGLGGCSNLVGPGIYNPLNPDAQGFSFDQLWFELERPVSPEQRSGFRADITTGKIADIFDGRFHGSDHTLWVHQANIQYLADIPKVGDVKLTLGKFATLIGYEVVQAPYNHNVSRGVLWAAFQPIDHLGFLMSKTLDTRFHFLGSEGVIDLDFGVVNGFTDNDPDINHSKTWTGRARMTGENWSIAVAGITGAEFSGSESEKITVLDVIMTWDPFTDLSLWMNFDRMWSNTNGADPDGWGISVGGHYTITERLSATLRVEFAQTENPAGAVFSTFSPQSPGLTGAVLPSGARSSVGYDEETLSITGTLAYQLSDQIKVRGEIRWDDYERFCRRGRAIAGTTANNLQANAIGCSDSIFNERSTDTNPAALVGGGDSDQLVAGVDVIYEF